VGRDDEGPAIDHSQDGRICILIRAVSNTHSTGVSIAEAVREAQSTQQEVIVRAMGASAVNQAVKAIIEASSILAKKAAMTLTMIPYWETVRVPHEEDRERMVERSAIAFRLADLQRRRGL